MLQFHRRERAGRCAVIGWNSGVEGGGDRVIGTVTVISRLVIE